MHAVPRGGEPQRHGPGRRPHRPEDPAAGPGLARPRAAADDPRQRLSRADRHPRPHHGRRRGAAQGQPRRPRLARAPARRQARRPAARAAHARAAAAGRAAESPAGLPPGGALRRRRRRTTRRWSPLLVDDARQHGDPSRGAAVFASPQVRLPLVPQGRRPGGTIGPDLSTAGACIKPEEIVESVLWPARQVKDGYAARHRRHRRRPGVQGYKLPRRRRS